MNFGSDNELIVKVYNINKGRNEELASRSETLRGYEIFIFLVREHIKSMDRDSAIELAVSDCIRQNVLRKFLESNSLEIRNMIFGEWDLNVAKEVWREEGIDIGKMQILDLFRQGYSLNEVEEMLIDKSAHGNATGGIPNP